MKVLLCFHYDIIRVRLGLYYENFVILIKIDYIPTT